MALSPARRPHPGEPWESAHFRLGNLGCRGGAWGIEVWLPPAAWLQLHAQNDPGFRFPGLRKTSLAVAPLSGLFSSEAKTWQGDTETNPERQAMERPLNC